MEKTGYERYGLTGNPFRDLSSESIENIEIFHVAQAIDSDLHTMVEEVMAKENKAILVLLGGLGAGKTERLLMLMDQAKQENALWIIRNITAETRWAVMTIAEGIIDSVKMGSLTKAFSAPPWHKKLAKIAKTSSRGYDPEKTGMAIADALNKNAPAFLLLNDMHNLEKGEDSAGFLQVLHVMFDRIDKGVMIAMTSSESYFDYLMAGQDSLKARINKWLVVQPLNDQEAGLMIAKRLIAKRVVEDMPALYPFSESSIREMNRSAMGNPRELLKVADKVIDEAARRKMIQINEDVVRGVLNTPEKVREQEISETVTSECPPAELKI